jgi:hypothetical protein
LITTNQHGVISPKTWIHIFGMHCFVKNSGCACWKYFEAVCPVLSYCLMFLYFFTLYLIPPCTTWLYGHFYCLVLGEVAKSTKPHLTLIFILYYQFSLQLYSQRIKTNLLHNTPFLICS